MQSYASVDTGLWYARSAEFLQQPLTVKDQRVVALPAPSTSERLVAASRTSRV